MVEVVGKLWLVVKIENFIFTFNNIIKIYLNKIESFMKL